MLSIRLLVLGILIVFAAAAEAAEQPRTSGSVILANVIASHAMLRSYTAHIKADFRDLVFPFMHLNLNGEAYYRAPDQYAVVFKDAPGYMRGFSEGYAGMMDVGSWHKHFSAEALPDRMRGSRVEHVIRLTSIDPKGGLHHGDIFVDALTNDITEMDWQMSNGMTFNIRQTIEQLPSGFHVVAKQDATFHVPFAHGTATFVLSGYQCNVNIGDEIFDVADRPAM